MGTKRINILWAIFKFCTLICLLNSFNFVYLWSIPKYVMSVVYVCASIIILSRIRVISFVPKQKTYWFLLYLIAGFATEIRGSINGDLNVLLVASPIFVLLLLTTRYKLDLLNYIIKCMSAIIGISIAGWILYLIGISLPYRIVEFGNIHGQAQYIYENHIIYLVNISRSASHTLLPRFSCLFLEPGYFSCLCCVLLYINGLTLKNRRNIVFLLGIFLSFSLAGYLLLLIIVLIYLYRYTKHYKRNIIIYSIVVVSIGTYASLSDNMINQAIIKRLQYDEKNGRIEGYNRSHLSEDFSKGFTIKDYIFGKANLKRSEEDLLFNGTDYKIYFYRYGLFGIISYLLFLLYPLRWSRQKFRTIYPLTILFVLIFAQTYHGMFWAMYPGLYILGSYKLSQVQT